MELASQGLVMWFEHKVGAPTGKYGELDQIQKYLDAANRMMLGIEEGKTTVEWPKAGPSAGCPRVVLFYVTRDLKSLDVDRYAGPILRSEPRCKEFKQPQQGGSINDWDKISVSLIITFAA
jgi:hypothetical protein